jgi:hypothetical protein
MINPGLHEHLLKRGIPTILLGVNNNATLSLARRSRAAVAVTDRPFWIENALEKAAVGFRKKDFAKAM